MSASSRPARGPSSDSKRLQENEASPAEAGLKHVLWFKNWRRVREYTRRYLALGLLLLLALVALGSGIPVWVDGDKESQRQYIEAVFAPLATLTATALGFFFARHDEDDKAD